MSTLYCIKVTDVWLGLVKADSLSVFISSLGPVTSMTRRNFLYPGPQCGENSRHARCLSVKILATLGLKFT